MPIVQPIKLTVILSKLGEVGNKDSQSFTIKLVIKYEPFTKKYHTHLVLLELGREISNFKSKEIITGRDQRIALLWTRLKFCIFDGMKKEGKCWLELSFDFILRKNPTRHNYQKRKQKKNKLPYSLRSRGDNIVLGWQPWPRGR